MVNGHNWNSLRLLTGDSRTIAGHRLTGVNFKVVEEGVLVTLKKESPKGPMVAFIHANDLDAALEIVAACIKQNAIKWKPDKWATMRNDKT